jgi:hypothetical protein
MLPLRSSEVIDVFDFSAADNLIAPSSSMLLSVLSENENETSLLPLRSSEVRDVFDLSTSDKAIAPSLPILRLSALSENEMKQQVCYS